MIHTLLKAGRRQRLARLCLLPGGKQQNPNQTDMKLRPIQLKETATENIGQLQGSAGLRVWIQVFSTGVRRGYEWSQT